MSLQLSSRKSLKSCNTETNSDSKTKIYNLIVLDKSGSMASIRQEAITGLNETLSSIRATQLRFIDTQVHYVSLVAFCSCNIDMIYDAVEIKEAVDLKRNQYSPCCCTPLYDAIGNSVNALKKKIAESDETASVLVTIITDGYENASKEWTGKAVSKLIEECKEEGWMFSFIGAGEDVLKTAKTLSIDNTMNWQNTSEGTNEMFSLENDARANFCMSLEENSVEALSKAEKVDVLKRLAKLYYK